MDRIIAVVVFRVDVGPGFHEQSDHVFPALECRQVQRGGAVAASGVDLCALGEQNGHDFRGAVRDGAMQGRQAVLIGGVHVGVFGHEQLDHFFEASLGQLPAASAGSLMKRGRAVGIPAVHVGARRDELLDDLEEAAGGRQLQRGLALPFTVGPAARPILMLALTSAPAAISILTSSPLPRRTA